MNKRGALLKLLSSNVLTQLLTIAALPILGRIYSPQDFGQLGCALALVSLTSVVIHGRYHMAVPVVKGEKMACALLQLALFCSVILCLPVTGLLWFFFVDTPFMMPLWLLLVAASMSLTTAMLDIFAYWRSRFQRFNVSARNSVARSLTTSAAQIALSPVGSSGLLLGTIAGALFALVIALQDAAAYARRPWLSPSFRRMQVAARRFKTYPLFGVPQGWVAALSWNALPLLLLRVGGTTLAGQYWVAYRLVVAPLSLFNGAYRQATLPKLRHVSLLDARSLVLKDSIRLLLLGGAPLLVLFLLGDKLFELSMGADWKVAGTITGWMAIGILGDLVKIPSLCLLQVLGNQRRILIWELGIVLARYVFVIPLLGHGRIIEAIATFSGLGLAGWCIFISLELQFLKQRTTKK
jgi:O-antigen/teichoic acid export membrane protein